MMYIDKMKETFFSEKCFYPDDLNMLLDYCRQNYLSDKIDIVTYKELLKELYELGAYSPTDIATLEPFKT